MKPPLRPLQLIPKTTLLVCFSLFFSANIFAQPSNDNCSGAITLTSNTSCNNNQYRLKSATPSSGVPAGCAGGTHYDVWFKFTAQGTSQTVTISSLQSNITNPEIQLFSGACGSLASIVCGTTTMTGTGLTIGNTYYIRVSNIGSSISSNDKFNICVTHPPAAPSNDDCSSAATLTPGYSCSNTTGNLYYATSNGPAGACGGATITTTYDVWYTFVATSTSHTLTVSSLGSGLTTATTYMQLLSGSCGSMASLGCQTVSTTNGRLTATGLTIGASYYARVYILSNPIAAPGTDWNFNICLQRPPANDDCAGATVLPSGITCSNVSSSLDVATTSGVVAPACFAAPFYDVWFSYTATAASQTITLSNLGSNLNTANIRIQEYTGTCAGLAAFGACATGATVTQPGHGIGTIYYVRVALVSPATNPSQVSSVTNNFNICVTSVPAPPSNDACANAILLNSNTTCNSISGTLINATATAGLPACGNAASPEVWYSFVAESEYPAITLGNIGAQLITAGPRVQLFSGACGGLTQLICQAVPASPATLNTGSIPGGAPLTIGATYYIRITTQNLLAPVAAGTYTFDICVTDASTPPIAYIDYSKSYVNITDGTVGGTIDPGDILEIRATLVIKNITSPSLSKRAIDSVAFYDTLNTSNGLVYVDSLCLRTNEGKNYKFYTDANDATDAGWVTTSGSYKYFQINMGYNATASRYARGKLMGSSRPSFYNNTCIVLATYRVQVTAAYGTKIGYGGGAFRFRDSLTGIFYTVQFPYDSIMVFESPGACPNSVSQSNILGDEFNGSFGTVSGSPVYPQNRGTSSNTTYAFTNFAPGAPQDYQYGIANNTSAAGSINQFLGKGNAARVHTVWDISGDHTNASNTAVGNLPCNLSLPVSSTNPCGYMLVVNASYRTDVAFQFNVSGACPDTYYEISAWLKNVCARCGCDSMGRGPGVSVPPYIPISPGDSSGVRPNIAVEINGVDYYTTGNLVYQGVGAQQGPNRSATDSANKWVKRAFVYKTGPSETNFTMALRNNAPGGGGNDWAIDDITFRTCTPELELLPGPNPFTCDSNLVEMSTVVRSFYNNYNHYKWEKSTDGGVTWNSAGADTVVTPTWNGTEYEYTAVFQPFIALYTDSGSMYRVAVATSASNLASATCRFNESAEITLNVDPCNFLLNNDILSFRGRNENNQAVLYWNTSKETAPVTYEIQRSKDGSYFEKIGELEGFKHPDAENNPYRFTDPEFLDNTISYYRIKAIKTQDNKFKYTKVIQLIGDKAGLQIESLVNPFNSHVKFDLISGDDGLVQVDILDQYQHKVKSVSYNLVKGRNRIDIDNTDKLPAGFYILRVISDNNVINRKIIKRG